MNGSFLKFENRNHAGRRPLRRGNCDFRPDSSGCKLRALTIRLSIVVSLVAATGAFSATETTNTYRAEQTAWLTELGSRGIRVHDPSTIVKCKNEYWVFYTGRGIPSYHSKDLLTWQRGPRVFTHLVAWVTNAVPRNRGGLNFWAPDVIHLGNRYLLYFSVSTFGKNTSAIGLATNPTLDPNDPQYHWTDRGIVVQSGPARRLQHD